jgi:hypothetical protein
MTRSSMGMLFGIAGAALATWWWTRRDYMVRQMSQADRGEVIFRNSPVV